MKFCSKCHQQKDTGCFTKDKRYADGLFCWCKDCKKEYARKNPHHNKNWVEANQESVKKIKDRYLERHPEKVRESKKKWSKTNQKSVLAKTRHYQAQKLKATPSWLTAEHILEMKRFYENCPTGFEVDHHYPLKGKQVSGLHVPWNLRYLPISENRRKSNKLPKS